MSIGNPEDERRMSELFDPRYAHKYYKDPEKHLADVASIVERCAVCEKCGEKAFKVTSVINSEAVCQNCGHKIGGDSTNISK